MPITTKLRGLQGLLHDEDSHARPPSLTVRLAVFLTVASFCLALALAFGTQRAEMTQQREQATSLLRDSARALADRLAPALARNDDLRASVLTVSAADALGGRVMVVAPGGVVHMDTSLTLVGQSLPWADTGTAGVTILRGSDDDDGALEACARIADEHRTLGQVHVRLPREAVSEIGLGLLLHLGVAFSCFMVLSFLAIVGLKLVLRPVRMVTLRMRRMAAGERDPLPPAGGFGEAGELTASFRALARNQSAQATRIEDGFVELARPLVHALESLEPGRRGHSERVRRWCLKLADRLELLPEDRRELEMSALLHDLGKPTSARTPRDDDEETSVTTAEDDHPLRAASLLSVLPGFARIALYVRHHHERFDGNGFPDGLRGERIPLASRIIAIADIFDRLTRGSDPVTWDDALVQMRSEEAAVFDPWLLGLFEEELRKEPAESEGASMVCIPCEAPAGDHLADDEPPAPPPAIESDDGPFGESPTVDVEWRS